MSAVARARSRPSWCRASGRAASRRSIRPSRSSRPLASATRVSTCARHRPSDCRSRIETFDAALAQLVVHFMADPVAGLDRDGPRDPAGRGRRRVRLGPCRWRGTAGHLLAGRPGTRPRRSRRITARGRARGSSGGAVRGGRIARRSRRRPCRSRSSTRASRSGGSRTRAASVRRAPTSPASTRESGPSCSKPAAGCCPDGPFVVTARAWAARGLA